MERTLQRQRRSATRRPFICALIPAYHRSLSVTCDNSCEVLREHNALCRGPNGPRVS